MFNPKYGLSDLFGDAIPHCQERSTTFAFVFCARIFLGVSDKADALLQMAHEVEMIFPCGVEEFQQDRSFGLTHFRSEDLFNSLQKFDPDLRWVHLLQIGFVQTETML